MRDLKFRVWQKKLKRMYYPGNFRLKFNRDHKWYVLINPVKAPESPKDVEIMQYLDACDTKGKDLYEADIVQTEHGVGVVTYNLIHSKFMVDYRDKGKINYDVGYYRNIEVVGNIYENAELIAG